MSSKAIFETRDSLPRWADGLPCYYIIYTLAENGDLLKGPMFTDGLTAYQIAEWCVEQGFFHSAWVFGGLTDVIRKKAVDHVG